MVLVILELSGGVVQSVRADDPGIEVILLDHDNAEAGEPARPFFWEPDPLEPDDGLLIAAARLEPPVRRSL